jgi:hypothetical protein
MHARLETMWGERDALLRRLVEAEHANHQLFSFMLMEGLQLPELSPAPRHLHERVSERFPPGESHFATDIPLTEAVNNSGDSGFEDFY